MRKTIIVVFDKKSNQKIDWNFSFNGNVTFVTAITLDFYFRILCIYVDIAFVVLLCSLTTYGNKRRSLSWLFKMQHLQYIQSTDLKWVWALYYIGVPSVYAQNTMAWIECRCLCNTMVFIWMKYFTIEGESKS